MSSSSAPTLHTIAKLKAARPARLASTCLLILLLMAFIGPYPAAIFGGDISAKDDGTGDLVKQLVFSLNLCFIIGGVMRGHAIQTFSRIPVGLIVIMAWMLLSVAWAVDPFVSLRRVLFSVIVILSVSLLVEEIPGKDIFSLLFFFCLVILFADYVSISILPGSVHQPYGPEAALAGDWRGLHLHKNEAGAFCSLSIIVSLHRLILRRNPLLSILLLAGAGYFLLRTGSKTPLGCLPLSLILGFGFVLLYRSRKLRITALLVVPVLITLYLLLFGSASVEQIASIFDDPSELTGRVQIWPVLIAYARDHLLLGSGYGSFWSIGAQSPIYQYASGWITMINHAHNGYINVLIQLGLVGLMIVVYVIVVQTTSALATYHCRLASDRFVLGSLITYVLLTNMLESSLLDRANPSWIITLFAYSLLRKDFQEYSFQRSIPVSDRNILGGGAVHA